MSAFQGAKRTRYGQCEIFRVRSMSAFKGRSGLDMVSVRFSEPDPQQTFGINRCAARLSLSTNDFATSRQHSTKRSATTHSEQIAQDKNQLSSNRHEAFLGCLRGRIQYSAATTRSLQAGVAN